MENIVEKENKTLQWVRTAHVTDIPKEEGACVKVGETQIAIFNFSSRGEWYATQNMCPHKMEMILSRGMIGDEKGEPKVACPFHKKTYSLVSGKCLNDENFNIETFEVKIENGWVYIHI